MPTAHPAPAPAAAALAARAEAYQTATAAGHRALAAARRFAEVDFPAALIAYQGAVDAARAARLACRAHDAAVPAADARTCAVDLIDAPPFRDVVACAEGMRRGLAGLAHIAPAEP